MARDRCPAYDPVTAEQLLSGKGNSPVARLLAVASAPAQPGELAGEEAAMAAFRAAMQQREAGAVRTHRRRRSALAGRPAWTRLAGVKVGVAVALVVSGVAVAAGTGVLPLPGGDTKPWQQSTQRPTSVGPRESIPTLTLGPSGSTTSSVVGGSDRPASRTPTPSASEKPMPAPALVGLCRAYLASPLDNPKATDNPAFAELIVAAGGVDNVPALCESLLTPNPSGEPSGPPGPAQPNGQGPAANPAAGNQQLQPARPPESPPKGKAEKKGAAGKGPGAGNGNAEGSEGKGKGKEKKSVAQ